MSRDAISSDLFCGDISPPPIPSRPAPSRRRSAAAALTAMALALILTATAAAATRHAHRHHAGHAARGPTADRRIEAAGAESRRRLPDQPAADRTRPADDCGPTPISTTPRSAGPTRWSPITSSRTAATSPARITAAGFRWSRAGENIASGFRRPPRSFAAGWPARDTARTSSIPASAPVGTGVSRRRPVPHPARGPRTSACAWVSARRRTTPARRPAVPTAERRRRRARRTRRARPHRRGRSVAEVPLGVQRRLASRPGGGHGLAVGVVDEVAGGEHARQVGQRRASPGRARNPRRRRRPGRARSATAGRDRRR